MKAEYSVQTTFINSIWTTCKVTRKNKTQWESKNRLWVIQIVMQLNRRSGLREHLTFLLHVPNHASKEQAIFDIRLCNTSISQKRGLSWATLITVIFSWAKGIFHGKFFSAVLKHGKTCKKRKGYATAIFCLCKKVFER